MKKRKGSDLLVQNWLIVHCWSINHWSGCSRKNMKFEIRSNLFERSDAELLANAFAFIVKYYTYFFISSFSLIYFLSMHLISALLIPRSVHLILIFVSFSILY